jgi:hypothetical protein
MKEIFCNARRQHRRPGTTDTRMMITAEQIAPRRTVACPAHHLGPGMA